LEEGGGEDQAGGLLAGVKALLHTVHLQAMVHGLVPTTRVAWPPCPESSSFPQLVKCLTPFGTAMLPEVVQVPQESVNGLTGGFSTTYIKFLTKQKAYSQILQVNLPAHLPW
jgi:hypothetical protein